MIERVSFNGTTFNQLPFKFEAGTPNIAGAIGLAAAVDYLTTLDRTAIEAHERAVIDYALARAADCKDIKVIGNPTQRVCLLSFLLEGSHPHDVGTLLDHQGIAVRTGHHCTQPVMDQFAIPGTVRASFSIYNTLEEVDRLFDGLDKVRTFL